MTNATSMVIRDLLLDKGRLDLGYVIGHELYHPSIIIGFPYPTRTSRRESISAWLIPQCCA